MKVLGGAGSPVNCITGERQVQMELRLQDPLAAGDDASRVYMHTYSSSSEAVSGWNRTLIMGCYKSFLLAVAPDSQLLFWLENEPKTLWDSL